MNSTSEDKKAGIDHADNPSGDNQLPPPNIPFKGKDDVNLWGILLFGLVGATFTSLASRVGQLRKSADWFYNQFTTSQSSSKGAAGHSFRFRYQEEAWKRYKRRMQEEYEDEMERVERIRRMQSVFNRERNKFKRNNEGWGESGPGKYHQHFQRDDWYWKTEASYGNHKSTFRETPQASGHYLLSHHYTILGLDRSRTKQYTDEEIKIAFRAKAMEFHPDQNQENKDFAEAKFKEVLSSYEAIKNERKGNKI